MAIDFERFLVFGGEDLDGAVFFERTLEIVEAAVDFGDEGRVGQARTDALRDVKSAGSGGDLLDTAVRQGDL
jgi:hypothetical protein